MPVVKGSGMLTAFDLDVKVLFFCYGGCSVMCGWLQGLL